jgi:hypothetical protein
MAKTRRAYSGNAASTTLSSGISAGDTTISITAATGWPSGAPFYVVIDPGTSAEEKVLVTRSSTTLTVSGSRGADDTSASSHSAGAVIYPVFTAVDANEANLLASTLTTQGDMLYHGASDFARVAIGTAAQVLKVNAGATAPEWGQIATAGIADSAVTSAKIADGTIVAGDLADGAVTSAKILDGTIATGDIANAAITEAKLASSVAGDGLSGGAGTALSVNTDGVTLEVSSDQVRIKGGGITNAMVADAAAIADTKLATISTAGKVANSATTAASANTASAIVARDASGNFVAGTVTAALSGNATTATTLATARNFSLTGDVTATAVSFNGSAAVALNTAIAAGAVDTTELANSAVTTAKIDAGAVTGAKISSTAAVSVASVTTTGAVVATGNVQTYGDVVIAGDLQTTKNTNDTFFNVTNGGSSVIMGIDSNQGVNGHDVGSSSIRAVYSRSTNVIGFSSSSQRFKEQISAHIFDEEAVLGMVPVKFKYRTDVEEYGDEAGWNYGFIAEQAEQGGLPELIGRDENGLVDYFAYERMCVAQQQLIRTLFEKVEALETRVAALESK